MFEIKFSECKNEKNTLGYIIYLKYDKYNFRSLFQLLYLNIIRKNQWHLKCLRCVNLKFIKIQSQG